MARERSPGRGKAKQMWLESGGTRKLKDIAAALSIGETQVRKWKSQDKWAAELNSNVTIETKGNVTKRGAPKGNKNAVGNRGGAPPGNQNAEGNRGGSGGPPGNKKAVKTGEYETIWMDALEEDEQDLVDLVDTDPIQQAAESIKLLAIRERRMLQRIGKLMNGLTEKQRRVLNELKAIKDVMTVHDEKSGLTKTRMAAVLFMLLLQGKVMLTGWLGVMMMPMFGVVGGIAATTAIFMFARQDGKLDPQRLILVGIAISSGFGVMTMYASLKMNPKDYEAAVVWLAGSLHSANWRFVVTMLPWVLLLPLIIWLRAHVLDLFQLSEETVKGVGVSVVREKNLLLLCSIGLISASVAVSGSIGFVGLIAPHLAKQLVGLRHRYIVPVSGIAGMTIVMVGNEVEPHRTAVPDQCGRASQSAARGRISGLVCAGCECIIRLTGGSCPPAVPASAWHPARAGRRNRIRFRGSDRHRSAVL